MLAKLSGTETEGTWTEVCVHPRPTPPPSITGGRGNGRRCGPVRVPSPLLPPAGPKRQGRRPSMDPITHERCLGPMGLGGLRSFPASFRPPRTGRGLVGPSGRLGTAPTRASGVVDGGRSWTRGSPAPEEVHTRLLRPRLSPGRALGLDRGSGLYAPLLAK